MAALALRRAAAAVRPAARSMSTDVAKTSATEAGVDSYYAGKERIVAGPMTKFRQSEHRTPSRCGRCGRGTSAASSTADRGSRASRPHRNLVAASPPAAAMDRLSYLYLMEDMWRGVFMATEVAFKPKVRGQAVIERGVARRVALARV